MRFTTSSSRRPSRRTPGSWFLVLGSRSVLGPCLSVTRSGLPCVRRLAHQSRRSAEGELNGYRGRRSFSPGPPVSVERPERGERDAAALPACDRNVGTSGRHNPPRPAQSRRTRALAETGEPRTEGTCRRWREGASQQTSRPICDFMADDRRVACNGNRSVNLLRSLHTDAGVLGGPVAQTQLWYQQTQLFARAWHPRSRLSYVSAPFSGP
jgi:hypothetical protein